jgi:ubiquinone/menaquinone biosynthesis C-methylase UbiE
MTSLRALKQDWDWLGQNDPLWAACTDPERSKNRWNRQEFFATGEAEIQTVLNHLQSLGLALNREEMALDFGCGPGRLTRALSLRFNTCYGVDISSAMVEAAKRLNGDRPNCHFVENDTERLVQFADNSFGFIYSSIVLQHIEPRIVISYLQDFARLLKRPGILVFQMPSHRKAWMGVLREKIQLRAKLQKLSKIMGISGGDPRKNMFMHCLDEEVIRRELNRAACEIVDVRLTNSCDRDFNGGLRYLNQEPDAGYVSKQYVVMKSANFA